MKEDKEITIKKKREYLQKQIMKRKQKKRDSQNNNIWTSFKLGLQSNNKKQIKRKRYLKMEKNKIKIRPSVNLKKYH